MEREPDATATTGQQANQTWGVDLSTNPKNTAAVCIDWSTPSARVIEFRSPMDANDLVSLIADHRLAWWGVDVPFGWPIEFARFVARHLDGPTTIAYDADSWASPLRLRRTDRTLMAGDPPRRMNPLSVAHDRLGSVAVLWAYVEQALSKATPALRIDRSGMTGPLFETYPTAIRVQWNLPKRGSDGERDVIAGRIERAGINIDVLRDSGTMATEHVWDALLCALAARARQLGDHAALTPEDLPIAVHEGWIHLPTRSLESLSAST